MERAKVREVDNVRYLFLVRFFLEYFLALREYEVSQGVHPASEEGHDFDLIAEISEAATIGYVALRMKLCLEEEVSSARPDAIDANYVLCAASASVDRVACSGRLFHPDRKLDDAEGQVKTA